MLGFKECSQFQWSCPSLWEHLCCISSQTSGGQVGVSCHGRGYPETPKCSVAEMFQLLLACGKELSLRMEQFPKLPKLGNAAHHAGSTQVSTKLKFQLTAV